MTDNAAPNGTQAAPEVANTASASTPSGLPPIVKEPMAGDAAAAAASTAAGGAVPLVPVSSIAQTEPAGAPAAAPPATTNGGSDSTTANKEDLTGKMNAADALAAQPEKSEDSAKVVEAPMTAPTAPDTTAPTLANGDADKEAPKPVSVEEVRDETLPKDAAPAPTTVTPPLSEGGKEPDTKAEPISELKTGEKRKAEDDGSTPIATTTTSAVPSGEKEKDTETQVPAVDNTEDGPAEKKLKLNGEPAKKPGRPKKDKKAAPAPVGRTARKTRSQGTAD